MSQDLHTMIKEANWANLGRALYGGAKLGLQKPVNAVRSGSNRWLGLGSERKLNNFGLATQSNNNLWQGLKSQTGAVGDTARFLSGANRVRNNPWVGGSAIAGMALMPNSTLAQTAGWAVAPWWAAAQTGAAGIQGLRANNDYWRNQVQQQAQSGVRTAGQEAMGMVNAGYTGSNYRDAIYNNLAQRPEYRDWLHTLNSPQRQRSMPGIFSNLFSGQGDSLVQNQISREILKAQRGI